VFCEPQAGGRHIAVMVHRTKVDFAHQMQWLVEERYPEAEVIRVVLDNLNTPKPASLSEAFAPAEARRLAKKVEFLYPQARQLAQYGRNRTQYSRPPMFGPAHCRRSFPQTGGAGLPSPA
jgi:uncharacterized protein (DUF2236 family)